MDSLEQPPVQGTELDGFEDLVAGDVFLSGEIGEGAGDLEDAVVIADDPDDISRVHAVNSKNQEIGDIWFSRYEYNIQGDEALLVTALGLDRLGEAYTRQGIGEAIIRMVKENCEFPIVATCPVATSERGDGAHLTGLGPNFVRKMRELKLIEMGCEGDCHCGPDPSCDEEGAERNHGAVGILAFCHLMSIPQGCS